MDTIHQKVNELMKAHHSQFLDSKFSYSYTVNHKEMLSEVRATRKEFVESFLPLLGGKVRKYAGEYILKAEKPWDGRSTIN